MRKIRKIMKNKQGMEMVQVAILVAIAVALGIIFKSQITSFVNEVFKNLSASNF
jgi:Flp pilus assembly pilin Flp